LLYFHGIEERIPTSCIAADPAGKRART